MAQHFTPLVELTASPNSSLRDVLLPGMSDGSVLAGVAFAHLRRPVPPVVCTRVASGWEFSGHVPWMSSWGICDQVLLGGQADDQLVFALVPARDAPGLVSSAPMELLAMQATSTVTLALDRFFVPDALIVSVRPMAGWRTDDRDRTADVSPGVFGLMSEVLRLLDDRAPALAFRLRGEADRLRSKAYGLAGVSSEYDARLALRADALEHLMRVATALVVATGGAAMALDHPAQRHLREAAFLQVQAQTPALRALMTDRS